MEESTGEGGLRRIRAELMQGCAIATNFRPAAAILVLPIVDLIAVCENCWEDV